MKLTSLGGVREVTGSKHLLETGGKKVLLDCGMHQGGDSITRLRRDSLKVRPQQLSAVVLSHAHLDHSGMLPKLVNRGFHGPIYCTEATRNLLAIMLEDAANLYFRDIEQANIGARRAGRKTVSAEYSMDDVVRVLEQCQTLDYHSQITLFDDVRLRFLDAGHILGSAIVELTLREHQKDRVLVFSGDLGNRNTVLMRDPEVPARADVVLMEATYGDRDHRPKRETLDELLNILETARRERGNIIMPAFAVGRTQELLFQLGCLYHAGKLKDWQVFLDSPMAIEVTQLYSQWLDSMDEQDQRLLAHHHARSLEAFLPNLTLTPGVGDSMQINRIESGAIIIAGSGMCNGGRVRHHFKHRIWKDNTHIVFSGFQAGGTPGRKLVDGADRLRMFGRPFVVRAQVHTLGGFSAHAGRTELIAWAKAIGGKPRFRLVHGEETALESLRDALIAEGLDAEVAEPGEQVEI